MEFAIKSVHGKIATVELSRGKVNPINEAFTEELRNCFEEMASDQAVNAVVITGRDKFFSFGLDIPRFLSYAKEDFIRFVTKFADLYTYLFLFPKSQIA